MSAPISPADRLQNLLQDATAAAALTPAEFYKIVEAGILHVLKDAARTITASTLHAFVREIVFGWVCRPDFVDDSEWFQPRQTTSDADLGLEAYVNLFNPPPASDSPPVEDSPPTTPSDLPSDNGTDSDEDRLERLGFDPEDRFRQA
jgi:hypothetical protein